VLPHDDPTAIFFKRTPEPPPLSVLNSTTGRFEGRDGWPKVLRLTVGRQTGIVNIDARGHVIFRAARAEKVQRSCWGRHAVFFPDWRGLIAFPEFQQPKRST